MNPTASDPVYCLETNLSNSKTPMPRFLFCHSVTSYSSIYTSKTLVEVSYFLRKWSLFVSLLIINLFFDLSS